MKLTTEVKRMLGDLCRENGVSAEKALKLLDPVATNSRSVAPGFMMHRGRF